MRDPSVAKACLPTQHVSLFKISTTKCILFRLYNERRWIKGSPKIKYPASVQFSGYEFKIKGADGNVTTERIVKKGGHGILTGPSLEGLHCQCHLPYEVQKRRK